MVSMTSAALCGFLNVSEHRFQRFVEVFIAGRFCSYIAEQLTGQDEEPFFLYQPFPCLDILDGRPRRRLHLKRPSILVADRFFPSDLFSLSFA